MAIRNWGDAVRADPTHSSELRRASWLTFDAPLGLAGQRALQARLARLCRSHRPASDRRTTGVSPHQTMTCNDVGGRVADGAGSSVAAEWTDRARAVTLQPLPGWCGCVYKPGRLWPLRMAKRVSKRATRGGERQSTEAPGHRVRAPRPERPARLVWTRRAWFPGACGPGGSRARSLGSAEVARRLTGPAVAEAPDVDLRRTARSGCLRVVGLSAIPQLAP